MKLLNNKGEHNTLIEALNEQSLIIIGDKFKSDFNIKFAQFIADQFYFNDISVLLIFNNQLELEEFKSSFIESFRDYDYYETINKLMKKNYIIDEESAIYFHLKGKELPLDSEFQFDSITFLYVYRTEQFTDIEEIQTIDIEKCIIVTLDHKESIFYKIPSELTYIYDIPIPDIVNNTSPDYIQLIEGKFKSLTFEEKN